MTPSVNPEEIEKIKQKVIELGPWFHQIEVAPGVFTRDICPSEGPQPKDHPYSRWKILKDHLPEDLAGKTVLDIGCADGFFALELARRGAWVVAVDIDQASVRRLQWLAELFGLKNLNARVGTLEDYPPARFDYVFCIALLYHLRNPLLALDRLFKLTTKMFLESAVTDDVQGSYMWLKPVQPGVHGEPKWFPTRECIVEMLKFARFTKITELPDPDPHRAMYIVER